MALLPGSPQIEISPDIIDLVVLPPLLYTSADGLSWQMALVLGAVPAGTDPVAVTELGRRLALPSKVQVPVQAESLFNDATSLVLFRVAVSVAIASAAADRGAAGGEFPLPAGGGTLIGGTVASVVALIRRRTGTPSWRR
ncbi:hypothetical protein HMPREF1211_04152 [Streptomyces sp. HGB0020]|nr:hypothetical protein HMPREF1211_04152 [Streptomyces sp. HGB0020]